MTYANLPLWFPLKRVKRLNQSNLEEKVWKNYIVDRVNLLGPNGNKNFSKDNFESKEEYEERGLIEIQSHVVLRLGVCLNPRLSAWFIETEGDLFKYRFMKAKWKEKRSIMNYLFPKEELEPVWLDLDELSEYLDENLRVKLKITESASIDYRSQKGMTPGYQLTDAVGLNKFIAIDFRYATFLLKTRKSQLYKGWIIAPGERMIGTIKNRYEKLLNDQLIDFAERLETVAGGGTKKLAKEINELLHKLVKPRREYSMETIHLKGNFDDHINYYPPCIQDLIDTVNKVGYVPHWERLQLGLYLKHTGMDVDEQLQYWYEKAVDNVGMAFSEFIKKAGYVIRHIYGLEGGKINYDMPSCSTIQNKMYCSFRHKDLGSIGEKVSLLTKSENEVETNRKREIGKEISDLTSRGLANVACAKYLELISKTKIEKIYHPMIYLKLAAKSSGLISEEQKEKSDISNANEE